MNRWWLPPGLLAGLAAAFVILVIAVPPERARPDRMLVAGIAAVVCWQARMAIGAGHRPEPRLLVGSDDLGPPDEFAVQMARLESSLRFASDSNRHFELAIRPLLRDLVEGRLRIGHGVDLRAQPARGRQLMGEELWQIVASPPESLADGPGPPPETLRRLVELVAAV